MLWLTFFFLRLIEGVFLYVTLQVVQPVACCSVQHHQVSFTTVQRTLAGNVLCGLVCSATLTRCWWRQSHLVHVGVKPAIASSNTVQAHKRVSCYRSCPMGLFDGVWMNVLNRQRVVSHLVSHVPSAHALVFPWASLVSCFACSERGWRDCNRFRSGMLAVMMLCSAWWSSASARRDKARHCLFLRMSGDNVIIPLTTGSMKVGLLIRKWPTTQVTFKTMCHLMTCGDSPQLHVDRPGYSNPCRGNNRGQTVKRTHDWSRRSRVISMAKSVSAKSMVMFKTSNLRFQIVSDRR